ncbi:RecE family exodeoxyribonuclease [Escherichia coli]|uniref:RecE family exodeoxyribonuclease n=1 Tax=Escherichia coli TaxID=562 RepID=UPI0007C25A21|nr:RecE family exodeoxyribonuclease [Escherichia coli]MCV5652007.1 PD-(D/E)XK nuclease-like domain-containing protein [Escherichia coli]OAC24294.1 exonuclease VIII [Escherichia coli]HAW1622697.1 exodeoxyribonuclease [Escherichia coli]HCN7781119.1 PD-(D/E)XK nuclease-like domain-containing protein [Escherichia coli]HEB5736905.1 PD-(D/E)XK nuclease-like domain-containing protein [Escherichia coli]
MEFFYVVKATQKSGKKDAVVWFTAKTQSRAALMMDVALEDAEIESGRGKDYAKPVRTDFPVYDDLPEEGTVDFTWCERYELADDQRTWNVIPGAADQGETTLAPVTTSDEELPAAPVTSTHTAGTGKTSLLENRTPAVRFAVHLLGDKYLSAISQEQHIVANELATDEGNAYFQNLMQAKNDVGDIGDLSLHTEWKLVQAVKDVFPQDKVHESASLAAFMSGWINADDRNQLVDDWKSGKLPAKNEPEHWYEDDLQICKGDDEFTRYPVCKLPFRQQLLAQLTVDELRHHVTRDEHTELHALESDTDNSYVQTLLLAAESCPELKEFDTKALWSYTNAVRKVFSQEKRHELALVLRFTRIWVTTEASDHDILTSEWAAGHRIDDVGIQKDQKSEGPQPSEPYKRAVPQNMANLSIEIAIAMLYPDAVPGKINRAQLMAAKELADKKDETHSRALKVLGKTSDITDYNADSIFGIARALPWSGDITTVELRKQVREWFTANGIYENGERSKGYPEWDEDPRASRQVMVEEPVATSQPQVANLGGGMFSIDGLLGGNTNPVINIPSHEVEKPETVAETTSDVQMEATQPEKDKTVDAVPTGESVDAADPQTDTLNPAEVLAAAAPELANATTQESTTEAPDAKASAPEEQSSQPVPEYPAYFEPGRYEGLPNDVYHAANGISSTQVKDARVSLMYFNARHVAKTIPRAPSKVLDMGNLVHALALQPENLEAEFSVEPEIPEGAFTTTATLREFIDSHNASLPALLSADDIKALLEEHNATLPAQLTLGACMEETAQSYMSLPEEFQRIEVIQRKTAAAMKACIKEYNATLPVPVKTSGSRDALLEQLAIINPDLVAQEAQKPAPLKVSGSKAEMIQAVKSVKPDAVFADELLDAWRENPGDKILVTRQQLATAQAIQAALLAHPTAGMLLTHPSRAVEVSYFGFDDETGLEVRVRPDLELDLNNLRIGADLKTISMWNVKQESLRSRLHREIIDRDYHLSAAMYCETAALDQFFWIFVNKDENYHWIAIIEASAELLELGMLEYRKTMRAIATGFDTGNWPAPITADYTDELNDFDLRRLEALRTQA